MEGKGGGRLREQDCPDFELANLIELPRDLFPLAGTDQLGAFVLSLALAYNDLKGVYWWSKQLDRCAPADQHTINRYLGQWVGEWSQIGRYSIGVIHEILRAVAAASENGTLKLPEAVRTVKSPAPRCQSSLEMSPALTR